MASSASAMLKLTIGSCLVALLVCSSTSTANAAVTCGLVVNDLTPCISYVQYGGVLPAGCCNGVRALYSAAQSSSDRQGVCRCLKQAIGGISYTNYNLGLATGLPSKCGVNLPYKISPSTDCNRVH